MVKKCSTLIQPFNNPRIEYNGRCALNSQLIKGQLIPDHHIFSNLRLPQSCRQAATSQPIRQNAFSVLFLYELKPSKNPTILDNFILFFFDLKFFLFLFFLFLQSIGNRLMLHQAAEATTNEGEILSNFAEHRCSGVQN